LSGINRGIRYPELRNAVEAAANSGNKRLKELRNFEDGWDLQRFITLVQKIKKQESPLKNIIDDITHVLDQWNVARNRKAHDPVPGTDREVYTDEELSLFIAKAKVYLPRINSLKPKSLEAKKIMNRLNQLQACLDNEDVRCLAFNPQR
jgi:hypothetical protein